MSEYTDDIEFKEIERQKKIRKKKNYLVRILVVFFIHEALSHLFEKNFLKNKKKNVNGKK